MKISFAFLAILFLLGVSAQAGDGRRLARLPERMKEHMMHNMRDHLSALQTITRQLADGEYDAAADTAEQRLGMSSMSRHGAAHMAPYMPKGMRAAGTAMHRAASRFAVAARNAEVEGGLSRAFGALSEVMAACVACHSAYRVH